MTPFDPRNCFYLEHRARIEEWTTLEQPARAACDAWLASLEPRFRELAHEIDPSLVVTARTSSSDRWPKILVHRADWMIAPSYPEVSIALEWYRATLTLDARDRAPYVGVRVCNDHAPHGPTLSARLKDRLATLRINGRLTSDYFPLYSRLCAAPGYWNDPIGVKRQELLW